jgi:dethiobiotin synthetase
MRRGFIITGTDTDAGKTVFSAALVNALRAAYWKPVQTGLDSDSETVRRLAKLPPERLFPEVYKLRLPASPHIAAKRECVSIRPEALSLPSTPHPLIIEGAGGLLVPLSRDLLQIDMFAQWGLPVILCAKTMLGTINHTLLSLEALKRRDIPIHGVAFIGEAEPEVEETIIDIGEVRHLGRLPRIEPLSAESLEEAFNTGFNIADFRGTADQ